MILQLRAGPALTGLRWGSLPALPDRYGFAAMYAGRSGDVLVAADGVQHDESYNGLADAFTL